MSDVIVAQAIIGLLDDSPVVEVPTLNTEAEFLAWLASDD